MAAQHLPRDLVRPSSGYEELTQKKNRTIGDLLPTVHPTLCPAAPKIHQGKEQMNMR